VRGDHSIVNVEVNKLGVCACETASELTGHGESKVHVTSTTVHVLLNNFWWVGLTDLSLPIELN
jgi:hypothetical protein